ncbi:alkaline phosphatase D family protein [Roseiconus lacunae]|uniref:alkaline phosphatase D family protein n=1 Tax=Roseiconus lacunae TaxID=2605694 RepID=UPI001E57BB5F|nr:alkaline phosphatase D family protein [Roseiconus lacunae]MCD0460102.1 alkaline phosphatase D family protein [Roseiconus lacunae]
MKTIVRFSVLVAMLLSFGSSAFAQANRSRPRRPDLSVPKVDKKDLICFALYTVSDQTLKLTAQLYPLADDDPKVVRLEIQREGNWVEIDRTEVIQPGWTATFRVERWDDGQAHTYRVAHGNEAFYEGTIRKNPVDESEIVIAAFTGNSIHPAHGGDISRQDLIDNVKRVDADLLFFSGDQVYDHNRHYAAWLKFGRDFGEIIRHCPTVCLPDDHDVGQPNLWGESGKISTLSGAADGGYAKPAPYVKEVERAQTSHLPDPIDPHQIGQGIGVYFTNLSWGNVDFAILEDRKFKTGPAGRVPKQGPRPDHIRNPEYDPASVDVDGAVLLGERQLKFLRNWSGDWRNAEMKVALSQTIFCGGAHIHGSANGRLHADMDSNGWPQSGRNRALETLRKGFAFHLAGDQHLATIFHHGIDEHRDAIWSFCVPSIANLYLRWWQPLEPGKNREPGSPEYTGDQLDGFANKVTNYAAANPEPSPAGKLLNTRAAGFGIVRLQKDQRTITMECWPRNVDVTDSNAKQYPGWPRTISQLDNYNPPSWGKLGKLTFDVDDPVVQLIDANTGTTLYTVRANGKSFIPSAPKDRVFKVKAGQNAPDKVVATDAKVGSEPINVTLK